jgi:hypothetical protein
MATEATSETLATTSVPDVKLVRMSSCFTNLDLLTLRRTKVTMSPPNRFCPLNPQKPS